MLSQYSYGKFLVQKKLHEKMYTETGHLLSVVTTMLRSAPFPQAVFINPHELFPGSFK